VTEEAKQAAAESKGGIQCAEAAKHWQEAASMRFDRIERGWLLGLKLFLAVLLIAAALAGGGLLVRMILAAGAIQGLVLAGRTSLRRRRSVLGYERLPDRAWTTWRARQGERPVEDQSEEALAPQSGLG
jgi:hypothetical protein